ncbi:putative RNA polymerase sigma factor [Actinokineospora spheciospongiae]|uniref:Putative RNA polymerase sigma factor n=1 Tax=Actinokineospora spheciospongiae TaxID=909613 RepID=W7J217_9PSEU|nr:SigE family RNA polymerase sigma factor [Actinokineospora spheciospongiae]EWC60144.1 putative RNA polymerase sigma factor [Actinokineospora spheciospongiae]
MTIEEFVDSRGRALLRFATALTCDPHLAEDIVQEVLLRAQRRWSRIVSVGSPDGYLRKMVVNEYLSLRRRKSFGDLPAGPEVLAGLSPAVEDPDYGEREEMLSRIRALPPKQRAVLALRYYSGLTDAEIAEVLGSRPGTVRSHASRALAALRVDEFAGTPGGAR